MSGSIDSRTANTMPTASAPSRRATNASVRADAWSSHWASSTTTSSGCRSARSARPLSIASPTRSGLSAAPVARPKVTRSATRWGPGSRSTSSSASCDHRPWRAPYASSISDCTPGNRITDIPAARATRSSSNAVLPMPALRGARGPRC